MTTAEHQTNLQGLQSLFIEFEMAQNCPAFLHYKKLVANACCQLEKQDAEIESAKISI